MQGAARNGQSQPRAIRSIPQRIDAVEKVQAKIFHLIPQNRLVEIFRTSSLQPQFCLGARAYRLCVLSVMGSTVGLLCFPLCHCVGVRSFFYIIYCVAEFGTCMSFFDVLGLFSRSKTLSVLHYQAYVDEVCVVHLNERSWQISSAKFSLQSSFTCVAS